jgi:hypothetical protein
MAQTMDVDDERPTAVTMSSMTATSTLMIIDDDDNLVN